LQAFAQCTVLFAGNYWPNQLSYPLRHHYVTNGIVHWSTGLQA